jgi:hypothetical protein
MTQYVINIGALPNDGTGDPLRTAFNETNLNFDQVFAAGPVLSNIQIANNTILTTNTNGNLVLAPNGIGQVVSNVNIVPNLTLVRNLGSSTRRWGTVYAQYGDITAFLGNLSVPAVITNSISSDDSTFVTIEDGLNVDGDIEIHGNISGASFTTKPVALATLTAVAGGRAFVNNANLVATGNFGNQVGSGGSNVVPVWSNGVNWYIG